MINQTTERKWTAGSSLRWLQITHLEGEKTVELQYRPGGNETPTVPLRLERNDLDELRVLLERAQEAVS